MNTGTDKEVNRMRRILPAALLCLLLTACARAETKQTTRPQPVQTQSAAAETDGTPQTAAQTETAAETEMPTIRTLPGHIESDVYVRLFDGDLAPGLRAGDAEAVKQIIAAQTWGFSYDNLSDVWIDAEGVQYAYDTQGGILTEADNRAAKLSDAERAELNAILAQYLSGFDDAHDFHVQ